MLRHAAAQRAASAAKKHASKNHWYEELRDAQRARTSQECEGVTVAMNHDMAADAPFLLDSCTSKTQDGSSQR